VSQGPFAKSPLPTPDDPRASGGASPGLPRWFDLTAAALGLSLLAPLLGLIWLLIRLESPGPPLYRQARIGRGGRPFICFKFRTMLNGAPDTVRRIEDFSAYYFNPDGVSDPRLTRLGTVLRKTSIDELPQLLNVVRGDMALVGPRPELPEIVDQYQHAYHERHSVLPGLTGVAQVNGRADLSYAETLAHDLRYVARRSLRADLAVLWRTAAAVASGAGAR
jgi:lipopolysaccharide/colanic/teichoic acid biosynthesis glycosyltransferase